tara:strand:- start:11262 stop:12584 length:1323 start_codon:yes stop_codon:yes gene_type:complete
MTNHKPVIAILGASGLIGHAIAVWLRRHGYRVIGIARKFTSSQRAALGSETLECPIVAATTDELSGVLADADIVVNCIGVLQDGPRGSTAEVHEAFVSRILSVMKTRSEPNLYIHISVPGRPADDRTAFSQSKRSAEQLIAASPVPYVILRPGFVMAPVAYGGSALFRALATLPVTLPDADARQPFAATDIDDLTLTIEHLIKRWPKSDHAWRRNWDVLTSAPLTLGETLETLRHHLGGPPARWQLPGWLLRLGARAGDAVSFLGWSPPIRSTSLRELQRGVAGDPGPWIAATGITPGSIATALAKRPAGVQERWFAQLYLLKALIIGTLVVFWSLSGLIALFPAFNDATAILTAHGFPLRTAQAVTVVSSMTDIAIGAAIAVKRTCRPALFSGIVVSIFYMVGAAVITPEMWIEPLGALVKTGPAIVLMMVALATLDDR